jgi:PRTRC genetic system ThiF family protein
MKHLLVPERGVHKLDPDLSTKCWLVHLIGAGGNGCHMAFGLARLGMAMRELGHPYGLDVVVWDDDTVSEANVGRQLYARSDVGQFKASVLCNRINAFYGTCFTANPRRFETISERPEFVISCVDSAASRRQIHGLVTGGWTAPRYWLDLGNGERDGQFVLGQPDDGERRRILKELASYKGQTQYAKHIERAMEKLKLLDAEAPARLRCVTELFPDLLDEGFQEDDTPSCSLAEALSRQSLFVNQTLSAHALALLWNMFRYGEIDHCGGFVNLATGVMTPIPVKPVK